MLTPLVPQLQHFKLLAMIRFDSIGMLLEQASICMPSFYGVAGSDGASTQSVKETVELISACRAAGVVYMDGTMWLHNPRTRLMKGIMSNKDVFGEPRSVTTCFYMLGAHFFSMHCKICLSIQ